MSKIEWNDRLEIGISVIDGQHRRIVDYINALYDLHGHDDSIVIKAVIRDLIDYTYSHFEFEEALMEEAGYESLAVHKKTHIAFRDRVDHLQKRFENGENIAADLTELLKTWLLGHIVADDTSYAPLVKEKMPCIEQGGTGSWLRSALQRFFPH